MSLPLMGPAAWRTVGVALTVHLGHTAARGTFRLVAEQVVEAIKKSEFEAAQAMLYDMKARHRDLYDDFVKKYRDEFPPELFH